MTKSATNCTYYISLWGKKDESTRETSEQQLLIRDSVSCFLWTKKTTPRDNLKETIGRHYLHAKLTFSSAHFQYFRPSRRSTAIHVPVGRPRTRGAVRPHYMHDWCARWLMGRGTPRRVITRLCSLLGSSCTDRSIGLSVLPHLKNDAIKPNVLNVYWFYKWKSFISVITESFWLRSLKQTQSAWLKNNPRSRVFQFKYHSLLNTSPLFASSGQVCLWLIAGTCQTNALHTHTHQKSQGDLEFAMIHEWKLLVFSCWFRVKSYRDRCPISFLYPWLCTLVWW